MKYEIKPHIKYGLYINFTKQEAKGFSRVLNDFMNDGNLFGNYEGNRNIFEDFVEWFTYMVETKNETGVELSPEEVLGLKRFFDYFDFMKDNNWEGYSNFFKDLPKYAETSYIKVRELITKKIDWEKNKK